MKNFLIKIKNILNNYCKNIKIFNNKNIKIKKGYMNKTKNIKIKKYKINELLLNSILSYIINKINSMFNCVHSKVFNLVLFIEVFLNWFFFSVKQNIVFFKDLIKKKFDKKNKNNTNKINYFFATTLFFNVNQFNLFLFLKCIIGLFFNLIFVILENVPLSFIIYTVVWYYQNNFFLKVELLFLFLNLNKKLNLKIDEHKLWTIFFKSIDHKKLNIKAFSFFSLIILFFVFVFLILWFFSSTSSTGSAPDTKMLKNDYVFLHNQGINFLNKLNNDVFSLFTNMSDKEVLISNYNKYLNYIEQIIRVDVNNNAKLQNFKLIFKVYNEALQNAFFFNESYTLPSGESLLTYKALFLSFGDLQLPEVSNKLKLYINSNKFNLLFEEFENERKNSLLKILDIIKEKYKILKIKPLNINISDFLYQVDTQYNGNIYLSLKKLLPSNIWHSSFFNSILLDCVHFSFNSEKIKFYTFILDLLEKDYTFKHLNEIKNYNLFLKPFFDGFKPETALYKSDIVNMKIVLARNFLENFPFSVYNLTCLRANLVLKQDNLHLFNTDLMPSDTYALLSYYLFRLLVSVYLKQHNSGIVPVENI